MPRVIGIDPGTLSIDVCGLADGRLTLDYSVPTSDAVADPAAFVAMLKADGPVDLIAGPSGYGLPLTRGTDLTDDDLRLAFLSAPGEPGGIGGLAALARSLAASGLPVVFTPGVIHLPTVPEHRKVNRVDLGTADKVCAVALAMVEQMTRRGCVATDVSLILVELGGAFTAAMAIAGGCIVDGMGGTSGPIGRRAAGALDGEVAFLAGTVSKAMLFSGGVQSLPETVGHDAYVEGVAKAVAALTVSVPNPYEVVLSGRMALDDGIAIDAAKRLAAVAPVRRLAGFARKAKHSAQGAALIADGLAGGAHRALVEALALREARGTALDYLVVISPETARRRIGIE
jgi:predicted butyrate kinase (DUF1464 family)